MPLNADIRPPPTLSSTFSHSDVLEPRSSVSELTDSDRPRKVPNRPSVTNSDTALFKNRSHSKLPPSLVLTPLATMAGVLTSLPWRL